MSAQNVPPLDRTVLDGLLTSVGGDTETVIELLSLFLDDAPQLIAALVRAEAENSAPGLAEASHTLKTTSAYFGAMRLGSASAELNRLSRNGSTEGATELVARIRSEFEIVDALMKEELARLRAAG